MSHLPRRQAASAQKFKGGSARKIHEIFDERIRRAADDVMRHTGAVGKKPAGLQYMAAASKLQFALPTRNVFDGLKWKRAAMNGIIRPAMLHATADHRQPPLPGRVEIEIEAARLGHLGREKLRHAGFIPDGGLNQLHPKSQ